MKIQLTIIGLGQIGSSVGMALANYKDKIFRVGHDKSRDAINLAKKRDSVDKLALTLSGSVKNADIVLLALPFQEIYPVLKHISQDLKPDTLVIDTSPLKVPVLAWAEELIPEGCHYAGFSPVIDAAYLDECEHGPEVAHADLFKDNLMGIIGGKKSSEKAVNMASNLAQLLGASPYFIDAAEMDGIMSMTHLLPQITAAAMLKLTGDATGWREAQKVAGKAYSHMTNSFSHDDMPEALAASLCVNQENTTRLINDLIQKLIEIRDLTEAQDQDELEYSFLKLQKGRDLWMSDRRESRWIETPKIEANQRGFLNQMLGFRGLKPPTEG